MFGVIIIVTVTDRPNCTCGFMSVDRVYALLGKTRGFRSPFLQEQLVIFPDITFTCSGEVVRWIMGGNFIRLGNKFLELHIWRPSGGSIYQRVNSTFITLSILNDENDYVHEYTVDPPLPFQPGDILGLFHPDYRETQLRLDYDSDGTSLYYVRSLSMSESGNSLFDISGEDVTTLVGVPLVSAGIGKD